MKDVAKVRRILLLCLFLMALGAGGLHLKYHPPFEELENPGEYVPVFRNIFAFGCALTDIFLVTFLFSRKKTAAWGYLLNGMLIIYGTVIMTQYGWLQVHYREGALLNYILHPTLPYLSVAWADFFAGAVLYKLWFVSEPESKPKPISSPA